MLYCVVHFFETSLPQYFRYFYNKLTLFCNRKMQLGVIVKTLLCKFLCPHLEFFRKKEIEIVIKHLKYRYGYFCFRLGWVWLQRFSDSRVWLGRCTFLVVGSEKQSFWSSLELSWTPHYSWSGQVRTGRLSKFRTG